MPMSPYYRKLREKIGTTRIFSPSVVGIVRNPKGEVLCVKDRESQIWGLPAGAMELGETPAQAIVREMLEETGLSVRPKKLLGVFGGERFRWTYPDGNQVEYVIVAFDCEVLGGVLKPQDGEIEAFNYFSVDALPPLPLPYPKSLFSSSEPSLVRYESE